MSLLYFIDYLIVLRGVMRAHLRKMSHHDNFIYLTFALILLLLSTAIAQQFFAPSAQRFVQSVTVVTLLVAVWGVKKDDFIFAKAFIFPLAIIISSLAGYYLDVLGLEFLHLVLMLIFFISTAYQTSKQVMFSGDIDGNKLLGAICLYLLFGLIWALLYTLVHLHFIGAFNGIEDTTQWYLVFPEFVYFSFVTLTTLGFGDISPTLPLSRYLVYSQAVVGQLYLAILVASLVGSRMSTISNNKRDKQD